MSIGGGKFRGLPSVRETTRLLSALRDIVNTWKGDAGNALDRVVTVRDLTGPNALVVGSGGTTIIGGGGGGGEVPGLPGGVAGIPAVIAGLTANAGFHTITLTWTPIVDAPTATVVVLRNNIDNVATAATVGSTHATASAWADSDVSTGQTYYYWVKGVSWYGTEGAVNAAPGTVATTLPLVFDDFSTALPPVQIVGTLPTVPTPTNGAMAFLTTDRKLYVYNTTTGKWKAPVSSMAEFPTWQNVVGLTTATTDKSITKPGATAAWDAGARSVETVTAGICSVQYKVAVTGRPTIGLSATYVGADDTDIQFGLRFTTHAGGSSTYQVYQSGLLAFTSAVDAVVGDVCIVRVTALGVVEYLVNGAVIYTSAVAPTYPLFVDTAFYDQNGKVTDLAWSGAGNISGVVTQDMMAPGSVGTEQLLANSVVAGTIQAGAIGVDELAANSVIATKIQTNAIQTHHVQAGAITADSAILAALSVVDANIATLTASKISAGTVSATITYTGAAIIGTNGYIRGGATAYNSGSGFWLGYHPTGLNYRFFLGDSAGDKLTFDGTNLTITGAFSATCINAVSTLNVAGNAITVPDSAYTASVAIGSAEYGTWKTIQTITINTNVANSVETPSVYLHASVTSWFATDTKVPLSFGITDAPVEGNYNYILQVYALRGGSLQNYTGSAQFRLIRGSAANVLYTSQTFTWTSSGSSQGSVGCTNVSLFGIATKR